MPVSVYGWLSGWLWVRIRVECDDKRPQRDDSDELHKLVPGTAGQLWQRMRLPRQISVSPEMG